MGSEDPIQAADLGNPGRTIRRYWRDPHAVGHLSIPLTSIGPGMLRDGTVVRREYGHASSKFKTKWMAFSAPTGSDKRLL